MLSKKKFRPVIRNHVPNPLLGLKPTKLQCVSKVFKRKAHFSQFSQLYIDGGGGGGGGN
jgi:hypothetical protein